MKIGLSCNTIEPAILQGQIDGIGFYTQYLQTHLKELQQDIVPYIFPPLRHMRMQSSLPQGRKFQLPYMMSTGISLLTPSFVSTHPAIEKSIDLFHATDHLVPKLKKIPVIATLHDALILTHPEWFDPKFQTIKNYIRKKSLQWADHVITISHSMKKEAIEYWKIPEEKISVVYNGLSEDWFLPVSKEEQQTVLSHLGLPKNFILVVGTLQPKKNIPRIIDAYLKIPTALQKDFPLVIVGKAGWGTKESLVAIEKLIGKKAGFWLQYLPDETLKVLFHAASLYLHPSLHEGFGLTLLQGMAANVPVLTSNITALPEVSGNAAFLVNPHDINEIAEGIATLLTDSTLRENLIAQGKIRAKDFRWDKCAKETLAVYERVY